jgi:hypothetical protein
MPRVEKLLVTNRSALREKYGADVRRIDTALAQLVKADAARGLRSRLVPLDDRRTMDRLGAPGVTDPRSPRENKAAVDGLWKTFRPDYLVIVGAVDVVPHQDLVNPAYSKGNDDDEFAFGDLPYACEAPYSRDVRNFRGPTRVVGRIPDVTGGKDARHLARLLRTAATYVTRGRDAYATYFAISAAVWRGSTRKSLREVFGSPDALHVVPPGRWQWSARAMAPRSHFINCHGDTIDPFFYGQRGEWYPKAHVAQHLRRRVKAGTVIAAECCYGAQLYDPHHAEQRLGMCNTYLHEGAYAFLGSSTVAYGSSRSNSDADLVCQSFLQQILLGASVGRAALEARQSFARGMSVLDHYDLKTLAQFSLMGDPSIHPVERPQHTLNQTRAYRREFRDLDDRKIGRILRRNRLTKSGLALDESVAAVHARERADVPATLRKILHMAARESGIRNTELRSFDVVDPARRLAWKARVPLDGPTAVHAVAGKRRVEGLRDQTVAIIATIAGRRVDRLRRIHSR